MSNFLRAFLWLSLSLILALIVSIAFGAVTIQPDVLLRIIFNRLPFIHIDGEWSAAFEVILFQVRLPHTILIALTGAALAGSGAVYQGLFRNPLADPYLIGVASGAGLGAVIALSVHWPQSYLGMLTIPLFSFAGALITILVVYQLARIGNYVPLTTLILAGVVMGSFTSALTSFLMLSADDQIYRALVFLLGGASISGWLPVLAILPYMLVGFVLLSLSGHILNVLQFGEEQAQQMGLRVERVKLYVILVSSLTTAAAVAFSGVIGFIGLVVPHIVRILWGADYRWIIPLSLVGGATALLLADVLARVLLAPQSLPVGIITALFGAPFFLWILRRAKREVFW